MQSTKSNISLFGKKINEKHAAIAIFSFGVYESYVRLNGIEKIIRIFGYKLDIFVCPLLFAYRNMDSDTSLNVLV